MKLLFFFIKPKKYWIIFIFGALLFLMNNFIFKNISIIYLNMFFNYYFNDIIAPIVYLSYINILTCSFLDKSINSLVIIILIIIVCSFFWEYVALFLKPSSIFDINDIICYFIGGFIFYLLTQYE